jgi:hypothetical protein
LPLDIKAAVRMTTLEKAFENIRKASINMEQQKQRQKYEREKSSPDNQ